MRPFAGEQAFAEHHLDERRPAEILPLHDDLNVLRMCKEIRGPVASGVADDVAIFVSNPPRNASGSTCESNDTSSLETGIKRVTRPPSNSQRASALATAVVELPPTCHYYHLRLEKRQTR